MGATSWLHRLKLMLPIKIVSINNNYFDKLFAKYNNAKVKLKPYFNKRLDNSRFFRPYICLNYQKKFKSIKLFPLSTYKKKDNLEASHFKYIIIGKTIVAKIVLNCSLIVPMNQTTLINLSKISLKKCKKPYKEILINLKNELQFCIKNYKFIVWAIKKYKNLSNKDRNKYRMLDQTINLEFNQQWINRKIHQ